MSGPARSGPELWGLVCWSWATEVAGACFVVGGVVFGGVVFGAVVLGAPVVGAVELGGVYLGAAVVGGVVLGAVVVRLVIAGCERAVVEVVEPVAVTGTSACAVRVIEPKALLSWVFSASSLASRSSWAAKSCVQGVNRRSLAGRGRVRRQRRRCPSEDGLGCPFYVLPGFGGVVLGQVAAGVVEVDLYGGLVGGRALLLYRTREGRTAQRPYDQGDGGGHEQFGPVAPFGPSGR